MINGITEIRKDGSIYYYKRDFTIFPDGSEMKMSNDLAEAASIFAEDKAAGRISDFRIHYKR